MAADLTQRMLALRHMWAMAALPQSDIALVAEKMRERFVPQDHVLYREGDPVTTLHFLIDGTVHLVKGGRVFGTVEAPGGVGIMSALARSDSPYDTIAATDVATLELETDTFLEILEDRFSILHNTLRVSTAMLSRNLQALPASELGARADLRVSVGERPLDLVERMLFMRHLPLYRTAGMNAVAELVQLLEEERPEDATVLWRRGDPADRVCFVVRGAIVCRAEQGEFRFEAGSAVGGLEAIAGVSRWYDAEAADELVMLRGRTRDIVDVYEDNPDLAMDFLAMSSARNLQFWLRQAQATLEQGTAPSRGVSLPADFRTARRSGLPPPRPSAAQPTSGTNRTRSS